MTYDIFVDGTLTYGDVSQYDLIDMLNLVETEQEEKGNPDFTLLVKGKK